MVISSSKPISGIGKIILDFSGLYKIKRQPAPDWLAPFHMALYRLVLYDWLPKGFSLDRELHDAWPEELEGFCWSDTGIRFSVERLIQNGKYLTWVPWHGFRLPFRLECDGNLIEPPPAAPDTSVLEVEPVGGPEDKEMERPVISFELDRKATAELERLIRENFSIINTKLLETWPFFRVALDYLLKAFLTDPYQSPAEQLLWHVTALEALLGKKGDGRLTHPIAKRLGRLLGHNASERERIKHNFKRLYKVRSDLVHGNPWKDFSTLYLYLARNLARRACLRSAELAASRIQKGMPLPDREQIIAALDEGRFDELMG